MADAHDAALQTYNWQTPNVLKQTLSGHFKQKRPRLIKVGPNNGVQYPLTVCSVHHDEG